MRAIKSFIVVLALLVEHIPRIICQSATLNRAGSMRLRRRGFSYTSGGNYVHYGSPALQHSTSFHSSEGSQDSRPRAHIMRPLQHPQGQGHSDSAPNLEQPFSLFRLSTSPQHSHSGAAHHPSQLHSQHRGSPQGLDSAERRQHLLRTQAVSHGSPRSGSPMLPRLPEALDSTERRRQLFNGQRVLSGEVARDHTANRADGNLAYFTEGTFPNLHTQSEPSSLIGVAERPSLRSLKTAPASGSIEPSAAGTPWETPAHTPRAGPSFGSEGTPKMLSPSKEKNGR